MHRASFCSSVTWNLEFDELWIVADSCVQPCGHGGMWVLGTRRDQPFLYDPVRDLSRGQRIPNGPQDLECGLLVCHVLRLHPPRVGLSLLVCHRTWNLEPCRGRLVANSVHNGHCRSLPLVGSRIAASPNGERHRDCLQSLLHWPSLGHGSSSRLHRHYLACEGPSTCRCPHADQFASDARGYQCTSSRKARTNCSTTPSHACTRRL
jgi:hypothetical protein